MLYWQVILIYQISTGLLSCTIKPNPQYGYKVNRALLDTVENHGLIQQVHKPIRILNNILDLLFTTNPDVVDMVEVYPGTSDHSSYNCNQC